MAQYYTDVTHFVMVARLELQDEIAPYRYADSTVVRALNTALSELGRIRPDMFLNLKYTSPLRKGDTGDGLPGIYTIDDIATDGNGNYLEGKGTLVPVPSAYITPVEWFISGWTQFLDVTDTQDQRAQAFVSKFQAQVLTTNAA
jgi:hypothetical protein